MCQDTHLSSAVCQQRAAVINTRLKGIALQMELIWECRPTLTSQTSGCKLAKGRRLCPQIAQPCFSNILQALLQNWSKLSAGGTESPPPWVPSSCDAHIAVPKPVCIKVLPALLNQPRPCPLLVLTRARSSGVWGRFLKAVVIAGLLGTGSRAAACTAVSCTRLRQPGHGHLQTWLVTTGGVWGQRQLLPSYSRVLGSWQCCHLSAS